MATKYKVLETMTDARGRLLKPGDDAPDEDEINTKHYIGLGVIGTGAEFDKRYPERAAKMKAEAEAREAGAKEAERQRVEREARAEKDRKAALEPKKNAPVEKRARPVSTKPAEPAEKK